MKPKPIALIVGGLSLILGSSFMPDHSLVAESSGWIVLALGTWIAALGVIQIGTDIRLRKEERERRIWKDN